LRLRDRGLGFLSDTDILLAEKELLVAYPLAGRDSASAALAAPLTRPATPTPTSPPHGTTTPQPCMPSEIESLTYVA
jgi:hypothetical protein